MAASSAGIEDSTIRTLGQWSSSAFLVYIHTPRESIVDLLVLHVYLPLLSGLLLHKF